jgi:hypothetical protein
VSGESAADGHADPRPRLIARMVLVANPRR